MSQVERPKRVVIVDADNPMAEIRGEFFWRDDHEQIVEAARALAFREGYEQGFAAAATRASNSVVHLPVVRPPRLVVRALILLVVLAFIATLIGDFLR